MTKIPVPPPLPPRVIETTRLKIFRFGLAEAPSPLLELLPATPQAQPMAFTLAPSSTGKPSIADGRSKLPVPPACPPPHLSGSFADPGARIRQSVARCSPARDPSTDASSKGAPLTSYTRLFVLFYSRRHHSHPFRRYLPWDPRHDRRSPRRRKSNLHQRGPIEPPP